VEPKAVLTLYLGAAVVVDGDNELVLDDAPGLVVEVLVVEDEVVVTALVLVVVDDVVVVVEVGDTPSITPPTVVPDFGPPKIEEKERPALTSTTVTTARASTKAPRAEPVAASDSLQRLSMQARSTS